MCVVGGGRARELFQICDAVLVQLTAGAALLHNSCPWWFCFDMHLFITHSHTTAPAHRPTTPPPHPTPLKQTLLYTGLELLVSGAKDSEARVWDSSSGTCLAIAAGHVAAVTAVAWSRSKAKGGRYLATGGADKLLKLWDTSALLTGGAGGGNSKTGVCMGVWVCFRMCVCVCPEARARGKGVMSSRVGGGQGGWGGAKERAL